VDAGPDSLGVDGFQTRKALRRPEAKPGSRAYHRSKTTRTLHAVALSTASVRRREVTMGIIAWIVLGAIAGWITNMIMGGKEGVIATIILGIVGAVVGGWLAGTVLKVADVTGINIESIIVAVIGAVIVVAVYRAVTGRRTAV
jgi:uncharacterized membrane protein YeaQ/YmgE (transglycosylase-associated protein family)